MQPAITRIHFAGGVNNGVVVFDFNEQDILKIDWYQGALEMVVHNGLVHVDQFNL